MPTNPFDNALERIKARTPTPGLHSDLHLVIDELRKEFGEVAKKGPGSFGFYLAKLKPLGAAEVRLLYRLMRESYKPRDPKRFFWWLVGQELSKRKAAKINH